MSGFKSKTFMMTSKSKTRKFKVSAGMLSLPHDVNTDDLCIDDEPETDNPRQRLNNFLNLIRVQAVLVTLVVMDTLLVIFLLLMELEVIQAPPEHTKQDRLTQRSNTTEAPPTSPVDSAEHIMHIVQLSVLCLFVVEIILRIVARGVDFVYDKWQVFDALVVLVTFALYVALTASVTGRIVTYSVGLLILLRLWRIGRIHHDLTQPVIQKARSLILAHRRAWKHTEEELKQSRQQLQREQEKVVALKHKLRYLNESTSPTGFSSRGPSSYSGDTGTLTSEEGVPGRGSKVSSRAAAVVHMAPSLALRSLRSRSLPSTTPRGSFETDSSQSLPGSPKSMSHYHDHHGNQAKMISHGSSGKIPDLVEHTQGADVCRDPSFKEALALQALALDKSHSKKHKDVFTDGVLLNNFTRYSERHFPRTGDSVIDPSPTVSSDPSSREDFKGSSGSGQKYKKNPDRNSSDKKLASGHRERSASVSNLVDPSDIPVTTNGDASRVLDREESSTLPRIRKDQQDGRLYPTDLGDKKQLLDDLHSKKAGADFAYANPSFNGLTEEELREIARVSQVPFDQFGSISHLLQEGIPISEL